MTDHLDLSILYYDISARSTVLIILQQTSCIYCLHLTLAIVVGLPSPQQPQIGYLISQITFYIINFKQRHWHEKNLPVQNNSLSVPKILLHLGITKLIVL